MNDIIIKRPDLAVVSQRDNDLINRDINILTNAINRKRIFNRDTYLNIVNDEANLIDGITQYSNLFFTVNNTQLICTISLDNLHQDFTINKNAIMQLSSKFKINSKHISTLLKLNSKWSIELLAFTFNQYLQNTRNNDKCLFRAVKTNTLPEIRGILSDSYHRYSTGSIYNNLLQAFKDKAIVLNTQYDGLSSYVELISNQVKSFYLDGKLVNMMFGLQIRNSSFGTAALDVKPFSLKIVCGNGMTTTSTLRAIHMTSKNNNYGFLSNETLDIEATLNKHKVLDAANFIFSDVQINSQIDAMTLLATEKVTATELKKLPTLGLSKSETDEVADIILGGSQEDGLLGNNSAYDVVQAITKIAQSKPLVREKELQDIGGSFIATVLKNKK